MRSLAEILAAHRAGLDAPAASEPAAPPTAPARSASELIAALTAELAIDHPSLLDAGPARRRHGVPSARTPAVSSRAGESRAAGPRRAAARRRIPVRAPLALAGAVAIAVVVTDQAGLLSNAHNADATAAAATSRIQAAVSAPDSPSAAVTAGDVASDRNNQVSRASRAAIGDATPAAAAATPVTTPTPTPTSTLKPGQTIDGTWIRPSATGKYNSCFCSRWGVFHEGIDFAAPLGSPILAVGDGTVLDAGPASGFGNWVVIQHDDGDVTIYGHMRYYYVHRGDHVTAGQEIALVGEEGQATGPHLHLGVRQGGPTGPYIDPVPWLVARGIDVGDYNPDA